jgi:hypothetical protein
VLISYSSQENFSSFSLHYSNIALGKLAVLTFILTEQDGQEELQMIISLMILELEHRGLLVPLFSSSLARPSSKPGAMTQPCIAGRRQ